jgi:5-methyltetrahydrofolate--homocysteine methyltransferase
MADLEALKKAVISGKRKEAMELAQKAAEEGIEPQEIINGTLIPALEAVGSKFEKREIFVPEMMIAAKSMQSCVDLLKPRVRKEEMTARGTVVLGTVFGDLHDIGKNLVKMLLESSGYQVVDRGENVPASKFVEAARSHGAGVVGLSSLLTTGDPHVQATVRAIKESDIAHRVRVICGGAAMTPKFVEETCGADAYARDAAEGVRKIAGLLSKA